MEVIWYSFATNGKVGKIDLVQGWFSDDLNTHKKHWNDEMPDWKRFTGGYYKIVNGIKYYRPMFGSVKNGK